MRRVGKEVARRRIRGNSVVFEEAFLVFFDGVGVDSATMKKKGVKKEEKSGKEKLVVATFKKSRKLFVIETRNSKDVFPTEAKRKKAVRRESDEMVLEEGNTSRMMIIKRRKARAERVDRTTR
jgi:hypothetical protein